MTVITPVKSDYARRTGGVASTTPCSAVGTMTGSYAPARWFPLTWWPSRFRSSARWRGVERLAADSLATTPLAGIVLTASVPLAGVLGHFATQVHYGRRIPFWSELRDILSASAVGMVCAGFVQFMLQLQGERLLVIATWAIFPFAVVLLRGLARSALASAGAWRLRVLVIGRSDAARSVAGALLSEPALGYNIVGIVSPTEPMLRQGAGRWTRGDAASRRAVAGAGAGCRRCRQP